MMSEAVYFLSTAASGTSSDLWLEVSGSCCHIIICVGMNLTGSAGTYMNPNENTRVDVMATLKLRRKWLERV